MAVNDENFRFVAGGRKYLSFPDLSCVAKMISAAGQLWFERCNRPLKAQVLSVMFFGGLFITMISNGHAREHRPQPIQALGYFK